MSETRLGFILSDLAEIDREQKARKTAAAKAKVKGKPQLALPAPLLCIAHQRGDE